MKTTDPHHLRFHEAAAGEPLVQFINGENSDGESLVQVVVDKRLAGASREALAALVHYEAVMFLADEDWVDLSETDRKLMGLVFAAARLGCDGKARSNDQKVWRSLLDATNCRAFFSALLQSSACRPITPKYEACRNLKSVQAKAPNLSCAKDVGQQDRQPMPKTADLVL